MYGIEIDDGDDRKLNVGQFVREDVRFVDSKTDAGVQIADLLASGLRRCLRGQFADNEYVASLIGSLMVQREYNNVPVQLISLGMDEREVHVIHTRPSVQCEPTRVQCSCANKTLAFLL
jgi:hypothetical protein